MSCWVRDISPVANQAGYFFVPGNQAPGEIANPKWERTTSAYCHAASHGIRKGPAPRRLMTPRDSTGRKDLCGVTCATSTAHAAIPSAANSPNMPHINSTRFSNHEQFMGFFNISTASFRIPEERQPSRTSTPSSTFNADFTASWKRLASSSVKVRVKERYVKE